MRFFKFDDDDRIVINLTTKVDDVDDGVSVNVQMVVPVFVCASSFLLGHLNRLMVISTCVVFFCVFQSIDRNLIS